MNEDTLNFLKSQASKAEQACKAKNDEALGLERMALEVREEAKRAEIIGAELRAIIKASDGMIDYRELLKKFILGAGGASGQCQVLYVTQHDSGVDFTEEEKQELLRLKAEAEAEDE